MRRAIALAACLAAGLLAALALTARPARAGLDCATDTAAAVAGATLTNRGYGWSSPEHPDPTWTVDIPSLNASYDLQAPDDAGARAAAKAILDGQLASMGCGVTTTTTATTTQPTTTAPATTTVAPVTTTVVSTETRTTTTTQTVVTPGVVVLIPQPAQTVTEPARTVTEASTTTATVTTPAPRPKTVTTIVKAAPVKCQPAPPGTKKKGAR